MTGATSDSFTAVAKALNLGDVSRKGRDKTKVTGLIRIWLASGALIEVEGQDRQRPPRLRLAPGQGVTGFMAHDSSGPVEAGRYQVRLKPDATF